MLVLEVVARDPGRVGTLEAIQDLLLCAFLHIVLYLLLGRWEELLALSPLEQGRLHQLSCAYWLCTSLERLVQVHGLLPALDAFQGGFEPREREELLVLIVVWISEGLETNAFGTAGAVHDWLAPLEVFVFLAKRIKVAEHLCVASEAHDTTVLLQAALLKLRQAHEEHVPHRVNRQGVPRCVGDRLLRIVPTQAALQVLITLSVLDRQLATLRCIQVRLQRFIQRTSVLLALAGRSGAVRVTRRGAVEQLPFGLLAHCKATAEVDFAGEIESNGEDGDRPDGQAWSDHEIGEVSVDASGRGVGGRGCQRHRIAIDCHSGDLAFVLNFARIFCFD
eukprot:scaffold2362_cov208-Pinguiococcus_pyrenoidosus.AAC.1